MRPSAIALRSGARRARAALAGLATLALAAPLAVFADDRAGARLEGDAVAPAHASVDVGAAVRLARAEAGAEPPLGGGNATHRAQAPDLTARPIARGLLPTGPVVPAVETGIITLGTLGWNASIGGAEWARVDFRSIGRNLRSAWVLDDDGFWVNQIGHPFQGVFPYSAARSAGLGFWASTPYPFAASALWEVFGETTLPSVNDQITTTIAGVVLGETLHRVAGMLLDAPRSGWRTAAASLFAPVETMNRALVGAEPAGPTPPARVELRAGALAFDPGVGVAGRERAVPELGIHLDYGPPGDPRSRFAKPFDRLELESTYSTEKDPIATLFARGVVAGRTLEGDGVRGLAGVSAGFDFSALRRFSVSTSTVGYGAEARWEVAPGVALEGGATASAVLLGAAGYMAGRAEDLRSYRMGPGGQVMLDVRILALGRIRARAVMRQYLISGLGAIPGVESISSVAGSLLLRVAGPHALGVEGLLAHHAGDAALGAPARSETGSEVRTYYALTTGRW